MQFFFCALLRIFSLARCLALEGRFNNCAVWFRAKVSTRCYCQEFVVSFGRNRYSFYCLIKHAVVLSAGKHKWKWCRFKHVPRCFHWLCSAACLPSWMRVSCAAQEGAWFSWLLFSAPRSLPSYFLSKIIGAVPYMRPCFMVRDWFLVFSVFGMGFYALWGSGFVKHDTFICRIFASFMPSLCSLFPLIFSGCDNDFYVGKAQREGRQSRLFPPSLASLGPRWCWEARNRVVLAIDRISMEQGLSLAHVRTTWLPFWPPLLTVHAQAAEGCGVWPESSPSACRSRWPHRSCFCPSHPSPVHQDLGSEAKLS